ncbi:indole-3-acetic acid-induced protein ARG2-like [Gastrolobium bilobum]|uniref:indole-3-acetic acid-induced protein ARG2-like n=1 Tax=Gastrolobium bilobum TaxID=150636 RepID=UPI002AAF18DC|nr:indole-3-acetic acid-induced protein ARG2-like [Gastrolobium bilobum]
MARSFTNVKALSALVADGFSNAFTRRGYAATTQSAARGGAASISGKIAPKSGEDKVTTSKKVSWVPDPVTGYYKPENAKEIDVAELRATVQNKKFNH